MNATSIIRSIYDQALNHKLATAVVAGAVVCLVLFFGSSLITGIREAFENSQVNKLDKQADQKQAEAQKSLDEADKTAIDRQVEDRLRELTIEPQRRQANGTSNQARARTLKAEADYEKSRTNTNRNNLDDRVLHQRNCADLRELYPGEPIAGCF